ncbi:dihydropyrimidinase [Paracoccus shanxieyensis]|uniref:Dihydropyrimidinase n=1 Tax=Paracoccus shanxieyensis TaxID=2675752 RepID=A0A6L6J5P5_9RHOB|nr:dihydropyrimidinase [Paracoccus shanxieyensis]MTH66570.1 dihydropyrimidinase [Paracoccus shanxieyensis]MTH89805.1 dihydropyrimidinase [Paracoccus shanxieyensis]
MGGLDLVITGGTVVTAADSYAADIGIKNGRIAQIGTGLAASERIDATGLLVLPGGIDAHVHLDQPTSDGTTMADDFASGTRSAAAGGNTTVLPFALQIKGQSLRACVEDYRRKAQGNCHTDVAFHLIVSDPTPQVLGQELPALVQDGFTSFKVFMTYDDLVLNDAQLLDVFEVARRERALVMVHAEGHDAIRHLTRRLESEGRTAPYYHAQAHAQIAEREATHRAISHAQLIDMPIVIVHVSGRDPMEQIQWARGRGLKVFAETCPQYITLTAEDLRGLNMDFDGAKYVCSPPPRDADSQAAIWQGLRDGTFDIFSSDHCPFRIDATGKDTPRARTSFKWVPNGIPGVETRLPILFSEGVSKGRISLQRFVALTSTNPARLYGLYPRKGSIAVGADADLTLWDPALSRPIRQIDLHHGCDYTPYEGMQITGWPVRTILRGRTIALDGQVCSEAGGQELSRATSEAFARD